PEFQQDPQQPPAQAGGFFMRGPANEGASRGKKFSKKRIAFSSRMCTIVYFSGTGGPTACPHCSLTIETTHGPCKATHKDAEGRRELCARSRCFPTARRAQNERRFRNGRSYAKKMWDPRRQVQKAKPQTVTPPLSKRSAQQKSGPNF